MEILHKGLVVALVLGVLTIVEYIFAVNIANDQVRFAGLVVAALLKAGLIMNYFMHLPRVWRGEEAH
jgi:cytochrome c oxidase subunit IV